MSDVVVMIANDVDVPVVVDGSPGVPGPVGPAGDVAKVADRTALAAVAASAGLTRALVEAGREGIFVFKAAATILTEYGVAATTLVTADAVQGVFVAPASDTTGASGAWVRKFPGAYNVKWFGAVGNAVTNDQPAIQAAINVLKLLGGGILYFPSTPQYFYMLSTGLSISLTADGMCPIKLVGNDTFLQTTAAIDMLTISCTHATLGNIRDVSIDGLGFTANNASARGLVLSNASYNFFTNLYFSGSGTGIVCGTAVTDRNIANQFTNIRMAQPGNGIKISGLYNLFTNVQINEGITGQYGIHIDGAYCVVDGFMVRGAGGSGGTAAVVMSSSSEGSVLANGTVFSSYAVGVFVQGASGQKVLGVNIVASQTHGLQLSGCSNGSFDVAITLSSQAAADTYHNIDAVNTPTGNTVRAQFAGTSALKDINEASGTDNTWICGSSPNGNTISGTRSVVVSAGAMRAASYSVGATSVINSSGVLQAAAMPALTGDVTSAGGSLTTALSSATVVSKIAAQAIAPTSVAIGGGTALTKAVVYTPTLTPASVAAATVAEQTFTVSGLTTADKVVVNAPAIANATGIAGARVSAADTLAIRFVNPTAGALTPTSGTYTVLAFRS